MATEKKIMLFGTFDLVHPGHLHLFWQARKLGGCVIVVIARDKTVKNLKKRKAKHNERERAVFIRKAKIVDKVILGSMTDKYAAIKKQRPDIIALGYDQKYLTHDLKKKLKELGLSRTKIIRLKPYKPQIYKTSLLKDKIC